MTSLSVLVVSDNSIFRRFAAEFLEEDGDIGLVSTANNCETALDQALAQQLQVILLALDISGESSLACVRCLREALPAVGIVALDLLDSAAYRRVVLAAGADEIVPSRTITTALLPATRRAAAVYAAVDPLPEAD